MLKVVITGGIGSGKSTVARIFEVLGIPVYYADEQAKWLVSNDQNLKDEIVKLLGKGAYSNGIYNREFVSSRIFGNPDLLNQLNTIVHPAVGLHFENWAKGKREFPYVLKEAAIVNTKNGVDRLIYVHASQDIRIQRTLERDSFRTADAVLKIMKNQKSEVDFRAMADFVITNESELLIPQVLQIHQKLTSS